MLKKLRRPSTDRVIRVWRSRTEVNSEWHVSVGSEAPFQRLKILTGAEPMQYGMAWDEALEMVSRALLTPCDRLLSGPHAEPPTGDSWGLVMELEVVTPAWIEVRSPGKTWAGLAVGEALAMFVRQTFPAEWRGFRAERSNGFALAFATKGA